MISKRSNTASAKGRDALCVPVQKVKDMEEVSDNGRSVPDGLSPFGSSPAVSPVPASIPSAFAGVRDMIPTDLVWAYRSEIRGGRLYHTWSLRGERGGIHVDAWHSPSAFREDGWYGGIEAHSPICQSDYGDGKPSHDHCWLINGPCWHDGSSLQFSEEIAPFLPRNDGVMGDYEHRYVLHTMINRYDLWLPTAQAIDARRAETQGGSVVDESAVAKPCAQGDAA